MHGDFLARDHHEAQRELFAYVHTIGDVTTGTADSGRDHPMLEHYGGDKDLIRDELLRLYVRALREAGDGDGETDSAAIEDKMFLILQEWTPPADAPVSLGTAPIQPGAAAPVSLGSAPAAGAAGAGGAAGAAGAGGASATCGTPP